jgi:hypothetical protein
MEANGQTRECISTEKKKQANKWSHKQAHGFVLLNQDDYGAVDLSPAKELLFLLLSRRVL